MHFLIVRDSDWYFARLQFIFLLLLIISVVGEAHFSFLTLLLWLLIIGHKFL